MYKWSFHHHLSIIELESNQVAKCMDEKKAHNIKSFFVCLMYTASTGDVLSKIVDIVKSMFCPKCNYSLGIFLFLFFLL